MSIFYAALSAIFAAITSILCKVGLANTPSNVATFIRTAVVLVMALIVVFVTNTQNALLKLNKHDTIFLILSGLSTGASWLFFYHALQLGEVKVVSSIDKMSGVLTLILALIFLHESFSLKTAIGIVLITAGTLFMVL